ncbi:hypothetical protein DITRI_Ditri09bG0158100 [Diplodiscus trichospermus]
MMAGAFLGAFLQVLFDRMASREVIDFIRGKKLSDDLMKKLKILLLSVNTVLDDAEEKQITALTVKKWVDELKDAVYDAEDVIDEIATEALKSRVEAELKSSTSQVQQLISTSLGLFEREMESKLVKIIDRLEYISEQKDALGLKTSVGRQSSTRLPTTSLIDESEVYGRDADKEEIMKLVLSDDSSSNGICVIAVAGMGGVGKTTLSQLVYNDQMVKEYFDRGAWIFVSKELDICRVTNTILEAFTSQTSDSRDLNLLQVKLKESLYGKKFLLVLDDVWTENFIEWEVLLKPFRFGMRGSKIIVTTRDECVASIVQTVPTYHLKELLDEDCWRLFAKHAFGGQSSYASLELEVIGRQIARKCKGLPLAAKLLGCVLRSKTNAAEWSKILQSDMWDLQINQNDILPALWLSYHYLPSLLKQCFTYFSLFPKEYEYEKEQLILLWMAEGFLPEPRANQRLEEVGNECFHDLVSRSLLQQSLTSDKSCYVMHDLVNDLAKSVAGEFYLRLEGYDSYKVEGRTRHLSYIRGTTDPSTRFKAVNRARHLRTFLPLKLEPWCGHSLTPKVPLELLPMLTCLRVVSLSHYLNMTELPDSIANLKHLRYLDLSSTAIRSLPEATCTLYNLQTIILSDCRFLTELPTNMGRLTNLCYLDITGTNLTKMPSQISQLKDLRVLTTFVVSKDGGSSIRVLKELQYLQGELSILQLQNVVCARDALAANLRNKKLLVKLEFEWDGQTCDTKCEREILDKLQPHTNLKNLAINYYGGTRFPDWLGDNSFSNLETLHLSNCRSCIFLPPLGQLHSLKELSITNFETVVTVGSEFYGSKFSTRNPFDALEILRFEDMMEWQEWFSNADEYESRPFSHLRELYIHNCPKLSRALPKHLPCLSKLCIKKCRQLMATFPGLPVIRELELGNCNKLPLQELPPGLLKLTIHRGSRSLKSLSDCMYSHLKELNISHCSTLHKVPESLKVLKIENCGRLDFPAKGCCYRFLERLSITCSCSSLKIFPLDLFSKLSTLYICLCSSLESLSASDKCQWDLISLCSLELCRCINFVSFPKGGLRAPNLASLWIYGCEKLEALPEHMNTLLPSLQSLNLFNCPKLESFPDGGLPSNLTSICISNCEKLIAKRLDWGLQRLPSLKDLTIMGKCEDVVSFPEEGLLPTTLTSLSISEFSSLEYLNNELQHLTLLQELEIFGCLKLKWFPNEGLPASLSYLRIKRCPLLKQKCQQGCGEDWSKICHIPSIQIDNDLIIS